MNTYIILSKISPGSLKNPAELSEIAETVKKQIKLNCPTVEWQKSYAVNGQYDVVDVIQANEKDIKKVVMILRTYGYENTESMEATDWPEFLNVINSMEV